MCLCKYITCSTVVVYRKIEKQTKNVWESVYERTNTIKMHVPTNYNRHESVEIDFGPIEIIVCTSVISVILVILPRQ